MRKCAGHWRGRGQRCHHPDPRKQLPPRTLLRPARCLGSHDLELQKQGKAMCPAHIHSAQRIALAQEENQKAMRTFVVGVGGVTNGGKTTLANKLLKALPNCSLISQDDYFKPEAEVATDERGFKQFDVLEALEMEKMMSAVYSWISRHKKFAFSEQSNKVKGCENSVYYLIVEGFLLYHYEPLDSAFDRRYFLTVSYEECKRRRSTRVYKPPDPPGYFDGHVWPMYVKHKKEMDKVQREIVCIDGTKPQEDIFCFVYSDITGAANQLAS